MKAKIVVAKLGERSCGFCRDVIAIEPQQPSAADIKTTDIYGLLPTNDKPISKQAGIKWAIDLQDIMFTNCSQRFDAMTYRISRNIF